MLEQRFEEAFRVDTKRLAALVTPRTRLVSITTPHNPTGAVLDEAQLRELVALVEHSNAYLLVDETYRDMVVGPRPPLAGILFRPGPLACRGSQVVARRACASAGSPVATASSSRTC